jgi:hypothetical protein
MKRSGGNSDSGGPAQEAYGLRRRRLRYIEDLPTNVDYDIEPDVKRGAVIVRRRRDRKIVLVMRGDRVILKPV